MVALRQLGEDPGWIIRIMITDWMPSHSSLRSVPAEDCCSTVARTPSVCEQRPGALPCFPLDRGHSRQTGCPPDPPTTQRSQHKEPD